MGPKSLLAAALVCAVLTPARAHGQSTATFTATDPFAWSANGTGANTLTITAPGTVTFEYPPGSGTNGHNVVWEGTPPPCDGNIPGLGTYGRRGWKGTCSFDTPGTYRFECKVHTPLMKGTVVIVAPEATAVETATPTPAAAPAGGDAPVAPQATPQPIRPAATPLSAAVAAAQKGTSVRGTVTIAQAASRLEVTVKLNHRRVGHYLKAAAAAGSRPFAVGLDARTRRQLQRRHSLKLSVIVAVGVQHRTFNVRLRG